LPSLFVGDLEGDALDCIAMQLLFDAAFPLACLVRITPTSSARSISILRKTAEA